MIQHALSNTDSATDAIFSLLETLSGELAQRLETVLWSIWNYRNLHVWEDVTETSATIVERARNMVVDWQLANSSAILASSAQQATSPMDRGASSLC